MPEPTSIALLSVGSVGLVIRFMRTQYRRAKPWVDRFGAGVLLVVSSPILVACAVLIKLTSRGPVIYKQDRVGLNGHVFTLFKLRTMYEDAEAETGPVWAAGDWDDPRVTPIGRLLRMAHLDEFPQLVNVLKGEMSLIGPRPERPHFVSQLKEEIPEYDKRLEVKPGITGLAQIRTGYDRTLRDVRRKVKLDMQYIQRMCWMVDFVILFGTVSRAFGSAQERGKQAREDERQFVRRETSVSTPSNSRA